VQELAQELTKPANLAARGGEDREVAVTPKQVADKAVVMPLGQLIWTQKRAPFNVMVQRLEGVPVSRPQAVVVTSSAARGPTQDWFSPGTYMDLTESEEMNLPAFQRLEAGIQLGFEVKQSEAIDHQVTFETIRLPDKNSLSLDLPSFPSVVLDAISERRSAGRIVEAAPAINVRDETWTVRSANGAVAAKGLSPADAHQRARTSNATALPALEAQATINLGGV
jgi:hypothetical protein